MLNKYILSIFTAMVLFCIAFLSFGAVSRSGNTSEGEVFGVVYVDVNENLVYDEGIDYLAPDIELSLVHGNTIKATMNSNSDGSYIFTGLQNGNADIVITDSRYSQFNIRHDFEINKNNLIEANFNIPIPGSTITGQVTNPDIDPVCEFTLSNEYLTIDGITSGPMGVYVIENIPMGTYTLTGCDGEVEIVVVVDHIDEVVEDIGVSFYFDIAPMSPDGPTSQQVSVKMLFIFLQKMKVKKRNPGQLL